MSPLAIDEDGWFTIATDAKQSQDSVAPSVEKPREESRAKLYRQLGSRPSTGPARKRDGAAGRTPSGWITSVENIQQANDASSPVEKRLNQAPPASLTLASVEPSPGSSETTAESKVTDDSIVSLSREENEENKSSRVEEPSGDASAATSTSSGPRSPVTPDVAATLPNTESDRNEESKDTLLPPAEVEKPSEDNLSASASPTVSSVASSSESKKSSDNSDGWATKSNQSDKSTNTTPASTESADTASITSTASTSAGSSVVASTNTSTSGAPKKLRPRARSSPQPIPTLGIDPRILIGKVLTHIRRSPDHPTVTLSFADGTTYQILVDGYDPRNTSPSKSDSGSTSRSCVLEMDEALLRMLEVPGRHVVDRAITDCAHIRLADKAYERREWEHSWQQTHVAVAFKFAEESRWHCVWAMRAEYDENTCIFRTFDDVYLQVLERQPPRSPQRSPHRKKTGPSPLKSPGRVDLSKYQPGLKPPPSPTASRSPKSVLKPPRKNSLKRDESWKKDS